MPDDLNSWVQLLASQPLPLLSRTKKELQDILGQAQLSVTQCAPPILLDPGMCMALMHRANGERKASGRMPLSTLSNALSHAGHAKLKQLLDQIPTLEKLSLPDKNRQGYLRYVSQACHAAYQARDWGQLRKTHEPEEMQCAALLQNLAELALWCYGDDAMQRIEHLCYGKKLRYADAAQQVLGCEIRRLSVRLAEQWHLPELVTDALLSDYKGFTLATGVALSSRLARLSSMSWYDASAMQCIQDIAQYKGKSLAEVETRIHRNAVALSESFQILGYVSPARLLPMLVDENYIDPQFIVTADAQSNTENTAAVEKSVSSVSTQEAAKPKQTNPCIDAPTNVEAAAVSPQKTIPQKQPDVPVPPAQKPAIRPELAQQLAQLQKMIQQQATVPQLIQQAVDVLRLAGLQRVVFAVNVSKMKMLVGRFVACANGVKSFQDFKMALDRPHLFSRLLEKNNYLWINDTNRGKYWSMVPDNLRLMLGVDSFFVMSVFSGSQALGLMYADKPNADLTEEEFKTFVGVCRLLMKGIVAVQQKPAAPQQ
ncbi:MAG: HDOD domain-containing protein [Gammaproteobacteria bacterium]|nr:MAG: HDOD domain-containing protein [Gammaproteobacteria bacterium]